MKNAVSLFLAAGLAGACLMSARAENLGPGQIDFGKFTPSAKGGEFVEVNLTSSIISMAAKLVEKDEPQVAKLLNGLQLVHVTVIGLDDENRGDLQKRADKVRHDLDSKGWERTVMAQKEGKEVGVYLKTKNKDTVQGLAVLAMDGNERAVFVNIVGDIKPEEISLLGEKLHIDPLKKFGRKGAE